MKPFKVVCIENTWNYGDVKGSPVLPVCGEIYTVIDVQEDDRVWYVLLECTSNHIYLSSCFREVDNTYGPAVCEQIEQIIELEETIEI